MSDVLASNNQHGDKEDDDSTLSWIFITVIFVLSTLGLVLFQSITAGSLSASVSSSNDNDNDETTKKNETTSNKIHLRRRIQHALTGLILIGLSYVIPAPLRTYMLLLASILFYIFHHLRQSHPSVQQMYLQSFGPLLRPHEKKASHPPGALYFLIGTTVASGCYEEDVARMAVLCLSLADPVAAIVGTLVGGPKVIPSSFGGKHVAKGKGFGNSGGSSLDSISQKTWSGTITCFAVAFCIAYVMKEACCSSSTTGAIVAGISCAASEFISDVFSSLDDNLTIPIITGGAVTFFNGI